MPVNLRKLLIGTIRNIIDLLGAVNSARAKRVISDALGFDYVTTEVVNTKYGLISYFCTNNLTRWRVETFFSKEPETLEWIDSFADGDVLWDVGANIGLYTIYAGKMGVNVVAFEPGGANYYLLNKNIHLNKLDYEVDAFCIALADDTCAGHLMLSDMNTGTACNSFNEESKVNGVSLPIIMRQGSIGYSIDDFLDRFKVPFPNHLKIDVDGIEGKIVFGAEKTLNDKKLRSISIELDSKDANNTQQIIQKIMSYGFVLTSRRHAAMFEEGEFTSLYNYRFDR